MLVKKTRPLCFVHGRHSTNWTMSLVLPHLKTQGFTILPKLGFHDPPASLSWVAGTTTPCQTCSKFYDHFQMDMTSHAYNPRTWGAEAKRLWWVQGISYKEVIMYMDVYIWHQVLRSLQGCMCEWLLPRYCWTCSIIFSWHRPHWGFSSCPPAFPSEVTIMWQVSLVAFKWVVPCWQRSCLFWYLNTPLAFHNL